MLITSTTSTAGPAMKKTSAPQPNEPAGLSFRCRCTASICRGMSAATTSASTRQKAVCTIQPINVKPHHGRMTVCCVANWATQHTVIRPWWGFTLMGWIVQTAFCLVLALVVAALMPRQMLAVHRHLKLKPAGSLGWGALVFFIAGPAVLVVLVISIVGLLVVVPYVMLALLAYFFAVTTVGAFVAQRVLTGGGRTENLMLATALGVIGTTIATRIP